VKGLATLTAALARLGIETVPSRLKQAYNAGRTTQVPTGWVVGVKRRVRRRIGYNGIYLSFERARPAPLVKYLISIDKVDLYSTHAN
jgi:hypothetical protein